MSHIKKKKKDRNPFFNDTAGGWDDVSYHTRTARDDGTRTRPPQEHETQPAGGVAAVRWSRQPRSLNHRRMLYCIRWFQKTMTEWVFFLARVKRRKAQIAWQEGYEDGWGVLANRIQLLYYKQRSEGSRKTGARTTLREKMLCYGAFSSLDSRGKLVGVGHETEQTEPQKETSRK